MLKLETALLKRLRLVWLQVRRRLQLFQQWLQKRYHVF
jgi:hypothetical protein